jgi:hypothetical protein
MEEETKTIEDKSASTDDRLREIRKRFQFVKEHSFEKDFRKDAFTWMDYFTGKDQGWDDDQARNTLESEGRPALTLNHIHPIIRLVCGAKPNVKTTFLAVEEGDLDTASILNSCKDHVDDINHWKYTEDEMLKLAVIFNRVGITILPDYTKEVRGEVKIELEDGFNVYPDRSDGMFLFLVKLVTKEWLLHKWPDKADEIKVLEQSFDSSSGRKSRDVSQVDGYKDTTAADYYDNETKKFSLVYYWYKTFEKSVKIVDQETQDVQDAKYGLTKSKVESELQSMGPEAADRFSVIEREFIRVKYITFMGDTIFEEGVTPWEREDGKRTELSDSIPILLAEPDRIVFGGRQELVSIIEMLKDPQKYHNKLASSILHIINTTAKSGYDYEEGMITPENKKKLDDSGSKPGTNIEWKKDSISQNRVQKRRADNVPQAEMSVSRELTSEMLDMSGVESLVSTRSLGKGASGVLTGFTTPMRSPVIGWRSLKGTRFRPFTTTRR